MSSLECNSSSVNLKKTGQGIIKPLNGRLLQCHASTNPPKVGIKSNSRIDAFIYKESSSPIVSEAQFGSNQTIEDSINKDFGDFQVDFFNYPRLIELATTIDPNTGNPELEPWKYYKLLIFLVINFGYNEAYALFTPPDRQDSGTRYINIKASSRFTTRSVKQTSRRAYNDPSLRSQIVAYLGGESKYNEKVAASGFAAIDTISNSLYAIKTPLNHHTHYIEPPRVLFAGAGTSDNNRIQIPAYDNSTIRASLAFKDLSVRSKISGQGVFNNRYADKIGGHYSTWEDNNDFEIKQRLYPIEDIISSKAGVSFVNEKLEPSGLYKSIDDSIVFGDYARDRKRLGKLHSDDNTTYITPSSIHTAGTFRYQCEVTPPVITPKDNFLFIRAAAPTSTNETDITPVYKAYNINLTDPLGNVITRYKDFVIEGDCDYDVDPKSNFTTYIVEPDKNYAALPTYYSKFPDFTQPSGYKLNIEFEAFCKATPFEDEFSKGYEHECTLEERYVDTDESDHLAIDGSPISSINQDFDIFPNNSLRISDIEILSDGSNSGFISEGILKLSLTPQLHGTLLERNIFALDLLNGTEFVNPIHPSDNDSVWKTSPNYNGIEHFSSSADRFSRSQLRDRLRNQTVAGNITLVGTGPTGSGRLEVLFGHETPLKVLLPTGGGIGFGSKYQAIFDKSEKNFVQADDSYFEVEELYLQVKAKKVDSTVPDIFFDVVGYSDDKVMMVTSSPNGFIQNKDAGVGLPPISSGYKPLDDLAIAGESFSERDNYFVSRSPSRGDHYTLTKQPKITSTDFQTIDIPLKMHKDAGFLGQDKSFTSSSFFEKLYLDIFPLPSGTVVSELILKAKYNPTAGMMMYTLGHKQDSDLRHTEVRLSPSGVQHPYNNTNQIISSGSRLSLIENIPHAYGQDSTLKTNYARRWRGSEGTFFAGPFDPTMWSFSYFNPQVDSAFTYFHTDFSDFENNTIYSQVTDDSVVYNGDLANNHLKNRGLRFISDKIFDNQVPDYKTLDWTQDSDVMAGRIMDSYNNAVKVVGSSGCMNFGSGIPVSGGFSAFTRFVPDVSVSGTDYNLFNSGVIFSKWDQGKDLEFLLGYDDGKLIAKATDKDNNIISINDTISFDKYQYPLSVLLTYNDNNSKKLKLYTNNEIIKGKFDVKRAESSEFDLINSDSDLVFGYSYGSGVGFNAYFNEIGLSDSNELGGNIVEGAANPSIRQGNVDTFFDSHSVKFFHSGESLDNDSNNLWKFVDEDTRKWHIGAFKYCEFNSSFDTLTNRQGSDYIYHDYYGDSSTYSEITDISLPSNLKLEGVAYHSQIENDMLRINLAGVEDEFFAAAPRISKNIPRNYNILEDAVRVNTVLQNLCNADVVWPDGNVGVKIIVSLYTKSRESSFRESTNFGLVNRKVHYVTPEDCWLKVHSDLSYDDIVRNDEPWSNFVTEQISKESKESYFVDDISKMFIQYDIAYPSGSFHSVIRMNSIDVTIGDMLVEKGTRLQDMPLYASGDLEYRERLNLSVFKAVGSPEERLDLYVSGAQPIELSDDLHMSVPYPSVLVDDRLHVMINYLQQVGSPFPTDQSFSNFGSQHYDSYREFVELLLKFDSSFDDLSSNDYSVSPLSNTQLPAMDSSNAKYGLSATFGNGSSIHVPDFTFDPDKFNGDWLIDFWLYLPDVIPTLIGGALGIKDVDTILDFSSNVFMGFGNNNNKDIGFKIGIDPDSKNLTLTTNMLNNVEGFNSLSDDRVLEVMSDKATSLGTQSSISVSANPNYFHNFEFKFVSSKNISDLRGRWTKVIIRKSQNILDIYCGAESNGTYTLDSSLLFDTVDTSSHSYPSLRSVNNDNSIAYGLDDLRFTLGSSRGAGNPGIDLSTAPDPSIQPPVEPPVNPDDPTVCKIYKTPPYDFCHISDPRVYLKTVPLFVDCGNNINSNIQNPFPLSVTCFAENVNASIPLFAKMELKNFKEKSSLNLSLGRAIFIDFVRSKNADLNLSVQAPDGDKDFNTTMPLYVGGYTYDDINSSFELFLLHESPVYQDPNDPKLESFEWTGTNTGLAIEVRDDPLAAVPADDEIRGVDTICFGSCDYVSQYPCTEPDLITHDTVWFTSECFEGGVFRSFTHYTNPDVMAFGGNYPYLRNYYGMRKFGGLIPQNPYEITISIFSGSSEVLEVPKEITEWEYGINDDVNYQPDKIITDTPVAGLNFGKSVAVNDDLMVVGVPNQELADSTGHSMPKCGELHVYRRDPAPSGFDWGYQEDKAPWSLEAKLSVPAEHRRDKFTNESKSFFDQNGILPFQGVMRNWEVTQNGRELGYSVDCTKDEHGNEIIVAGGPGAVFDRGFPPVNANPVEIALFIVTNEFNPNLNPQPILDALRDKDLLYKYFSEPPVEFSVKVIICEAILGTNVESGGDIPEPKPSFVSQHKIHRHTRYDVSTQAYKDKEDLILEDLKNIFEEEYPLTPNVLNSGLPALMSIYLDTSVSLGKRAMGQDKVVGKGALDRFVDYFKEYTYDNGLQNVFTPPIAASGYGHITYDRTEGWIEEGGKALDEITDTGRMIETNTFTLFANNLGTFNSSASEFNNPPPSGGAVYVFQKPSGVDYWHIIQEINSPTRKKDDVPDRFGHAVSISDDGKVIAIGSPYSEHNVKILQSMEVNGQPSFNIDETIRYNILPWLLENYHDTLYLQLRELLTASGNESRTTRDFYDNVLSSDQKYNFFVNYILGNRNSQPYDLIKSLNASVGSGGWGRMYNELIPTQRMGYSIDVNENGSAIAIGCPTDSLGSRDNTLTAFRYYTGRGFSNLGDMSHHWQNYSYAGAVRLLEARKYYPHNKVVEYGKFGNLHETIHLNENNSDLFSEFRDSIYYNMGIEYVKTNFVDTEIPSDAGVLYIITPEIDSASEEIIEKIKAWLSLGDRNLVLVGDDPFYEANGKYESSNDIVNYLLERLDINLRIFPARTEYEARVNPEKFDNLKLNAVGVPKQRTTTPDSVYRGTLAASGVGDIRLFDESINNYYSCFWQPDDSSPFALIGCKKQPYRKVNNRCNMPITHLGDLRAEWNDQCIFTTPKGCAVITYPVSTAFAYGSTNEDFFGCYDWEIGPILPENANVRDRSEPIPLIAAAEILQRTVVVEPTPPSEYTVQVKIGETSENIRNRKSMSIPNSGTKFVWTDENPEYANLILNLNNIDSQSLFYDPLEYDETNAILAANASVKNRAVPEDKVVGKAVFAAEQEFGDLETPSIVTLIAGTYPEDRDRINDTQFDQGYNFYGNILRYENIPTPKLALLNGFTGRNDFQDGYKNSAMPSILEAFGIESEYNVETSDLVDDSKGYDIVWIANSLNTASDVDIENIKAFIEKGNKKVIITYGHAPEQTENASTTDIESYSSTSLLATSVASDLCDRLGLAMKPLFLPTKNHYAAKNDTNATRATFNTIYANKNSRAYQFGTAEENEFETYYFREFNEFTGKYYPVDYPQDFIPIKISENAVALALFGGNTFSGSYNIVDDTFSSEGSPIFRTGITKVTFDLPEIDVDNDEDEYNLYQIVFDLVSETEYERHPINAYIDAHVTSSLFSGTIIGDRDRLSYVTLPIPEARSRYDISDIDDEGNTYTTGVEGRLVELYSNSSTVEQKSIMAQIPTGETQLDIYFEAIDNYPYEVDPDPLRTIRIVGISGVRVPTIETNEIIKSPIYGTETRTRPGSPGYSYDVDYVRPISTESSKYCPSKDSERSCDTPPPTGYDTPGPDIADGPVVVAQSIYHQGGYFSGHNKSRVTVISDASLIQGDNIIIDKNQRITAPALPPFLASLYPTDFFNANESGDNSRGWTYANELKIISPERGSPSRYINSYPHISGLNSRFGGHPANNPVPHSYFSDSEGSHDLNPQGALRLVNPPNRTMLPLLRAVDEGKFYKEPKPLQKSPADIFAEGGLWQGMTQEEYEHKWYYTKIYEVMEALHADGKLLDTYNGVSYRDAGMNEVMPPILRETGYDHLDIEHFGSGYPGDLFGFSVKFHKGDLYVGAPFAAYTGTGIKPWSQVIEEDGGSGSIDGIELGSRGGAGIVYRLEDTKGVRKGSGSKFGQLDPANDISWAFKEKIQPSKKYVGHDNQTPQTASGILGNHVYTQTFLDNHFGMPDMFGYHIDAAGDVLAVSAPGHDFDIVFENINAPFIRKEFNEQFNIQDRVKHDLAIDSVRAIANSSGVNIINRGSIFTYENRITDWGSKRRGWTPVHKITTSGHNTRLQSENSNSYFGQSFALDRAFRTDSDYVLVVGNKHHQFNNTDNVTTSGVGAVFSYDGMLRRLRPAFSHPDTYIDGKVFSSGNEPITFRVENGNEFNKLTEVTGVILSNNYGEIFLEASGFDNLERSYAINRPYVHSIIGTLKRGTPAIQYGRLFVEGSPLFEDVDIDLFVKVENQLEVYNKLELYTQSAYFASGEMPLFASGQTPTGGELKLYTSGWYPPSKNELILHTQGF